MCRSPPRSHIFMIYTSPIATNIAVLYGLRVGSAGLDVIINIISITDLGLQITDLT